VRERGEKRVRRWGERVRDGERGRELRGDGC
jgi:hypothetical protein